MYHMVVHFNYQKQSNSSDILLTIREQISFQTEEVQGSSQESYIISRVYYENLKPKKQIMFKI